MSIYYIQPDIASRNQAIIAGEHRWILPGMICPTCGVWGSVGVEFPCIKPSKLQTRYFRTKPQTLDWFKTVFPQSNLRLPNGALATPTTEVGEFVGRVESGRELSDFSWPRSWTLLVRREVKNVLQESGLHFAGFAQAQINGIQEYPDNIHEVQIEYGRSLHETCIVRSGPDCSLCGRVPVSLKDGPLRLKKGSAGRFDLFRASNFPTLIFCTQDFMNLCRRRSFSNIIFQRVASE